MQSRTDALLALYKGGRCEVHTVPGDGACFYHSLATYCDIPGNRDLQSKSSAIKDVIMYHMYKSSMRGRYEDWHRIMYPEYRGCLVDFYRPIGQFADEITVRAAVDALNISIYIITHSIGSKGGAEHHALEFVPDRCGRIGNGRKNPGIVVLSLRDEHYQPCHISSSVDRFLFCAGCESDRGALV
jgi:hypothetical protein